MFRKLILFAAFLTFCVVVLGAYVRLSDAGLGCPDWPGCYGKITPHHAAGHIEEAHAAAPHGPVSMAKAWKEMVHRYLAASLGFLIVVIAAMAWRMRARLAQSPWLPTVLVGVVILQGLFGKWTVTMLLKPAIVTGHLVGGLTTLALLTWLAMRQAASRPGGRTSGGLRIAAALGFVLLACQITLGGWVSTNYAALACRDLPTCQGAWLPAMDFANAFHVVRELGQTASGELLSLSALTAIHWAHRVGAMLVAGYLLVLGAMLAGAGMRSEGVLLVAMVVLQFCLGLSNVWFGLPLGIAVAHNGGAALLVVLLTVINFRVAGSAAQVTLAFHPKIVSQSPR
jgi:cytochrome c oxidase assembly protein subunit 15